MRQNVAKRNVPSATKKGGNYEYKDKFSWN